MHFFGTFGKKISQGKYKFMYMKIIGIMTINHTRDITSLTGTGSDSEFSVLLLTDATEKSLIFQHLFQLRWCYIKEVVWCSYIRNKAFSWKWNILVLYVLLTDSDVDNILNKILEQNYKMILVSGIVGSLSVISISSFKMFTILLGLNQLQRSQFLFVLYEHDYTTEQKYFCCVYAT